VAAVAARLEVAEVVRHDSGPPCCVKKLFTDLRVFEKESVKYG
jgi:hypothetical protein